MIKGSAALYEDLHPIFDCDYPPTVVHNFLAQLPMRLRACAKPDAHARIVTTNYDDVLEIAFDAAHEPFDLCSYIAEGTQRGRFVHIDHDTVPQIIDKPNEYTRLSTAQRSVITKVHGSVKRRQADADADDYVITEEHYLDYLANSHAANLFPVKIVEKIRRSHILFLGYGLRD